MAEENEGGFVIDGKEYPVPGIDTFNMDEALLLYEYAGVSLEDFAPVDPMDPDAEELEAERVRKLRHPGLLKTLLHVAYARGNPSVPQKKVAQLIGSVNLLEAMERLAGGGEQEDDGSLPTAQSTSERPKSSPSALVDSSVSSGNGSPTTSDEPDSTLVATGATRSATSPTLDHAT